MASPMPTTTAFDFGAREACTVACASVAAIAKSVIRNLLVLSRSLPQRSSTFIANAPTDSGARIAASTVGRKSGFLSRSSGESFSSGESAAYAAIS